MSIVSIAISVLAEDAPKIRALCNVSFLLIIVSLAFGYCQYHGVFGDPLSLNRENYHHVLSVTPLGDGSTAVILRNENGNTVPVRFFTPVAIDTNGLFTVVGDTFDNCRLIPIK